MWLYMGLLALLGVLPCTFSSQGNLKECISRILGFGLDRLVYLYEEGFEVFGLVPPNVSVTVVNMDSGLYVEGLDVLVSFKSLEKFNASLRHYGSGKFVTAVYFGVEDKLANLFEVLWGHFLVNVVVVLGDLAVFTYRPISEGRCRSSLPVRLGYCNESVEFARESDARVFRNCTLKVYGYPISPLVNEDGFESNTGVEVVMVREILLSLGLKCNYSNDRYDNWGYKFDNGSYSYALGEAADKIVDLVFGAIEIVPDWCLDFDCTHSHSVLDMSFFVPKARQKNPWMNILYVFHYKVWLATLASLLACTVTWHLMAPNPNFCNSFLLILSILLSSVHHLPQDHKFTLGTWTLAFLVIISSYQTLLTSYMFKPVFHEQIATLDQLIRARLSFGGLPAAKYMATKDILDPKTQTYIDDQFQSCSLSGAECYEKLIRGDFALWKNGRSIMYHLSFNRSHRVFRLAPKNVPMTMYLPKGSIYTESFNRVIAKMIEGGLIDHWDVYVWRNPPVTYTPIPRAISLHHLRLIVVVYCCGLLIALAAFVYETVESAL